MDSSPLFKICGLKGEDFRCGIEIAIPFDKMRKAEDHHPITCYQWVRALTIAVIAMALKLRFDSSGDSFGSPLQLHYLVGLLGFGVT